MVSSIGESLETPNDDLWGLLCFNYLRLEIIKNPSRRRGRPECEATFGAAALPGSLEDGFHLNNISRRLSYGVLAEGGKADDLRAQGTTGGCDS